MSPQSSSLWETVVLPLTDPLSRTWWASLVVFCIIALAFGIHRRSDWSFRRVLRALVHPSSQLDVQLYLGRQLLRWLAGAGGAAGSLWVATRLVSQLDGVVGVPVGIEVPQWLLTAVYSVTLFVGWDASRFVVHYLMHNVPGLWQLHQVHHSARVLTPLTFHRIHPLESVLYQLRGALVTGGIAGVFFWMFRESVDPWTLGGVPALGLVLNVLFGNLRHSHVWIRFPAVLERWFLSPAQHQLHHSAMPEHYGSNYGTWLAVWDRWAGSLQVSAADPPAAVGIPAEDRNHGDDLVSAWIGPLRESRLATVLVAGLLLLSFGRVVWASESTDSGESESEVGSDEFGLELIVTADGRPPRVAGSAQEISQEALEQFEYDDVERVLSMSVPGVTTRSEDGFGLRPNIGIRGANSDRSAKITLMEDGVLFAPAPYAAPAAYYFPMSTRIVGLEVFKGAASTRHGPNTIGGAINLLTRPVPQNDSVWGVDIAGGLRQTVKGHGFVGVGADSLGFVGEVVHLQTGGFKTIDSPDPKVSEDTGFERTDAMVKGRWRPSAQDSVVLKLGYGRERSNETYLGLTLRDFERNPYRRYAASQKGRMEWDRTQAELFWSTRPSDAVQVSSAAYHHYLKRDWTKVNGFRDGPDLHTLLGADSTSGQAEVFMAVLRGEEDSRGTSQQLMLGTNAREFHSYGVQSRARWRKNSASVGSELEAGVRLHGDHVARLHTETPQLMRGGRLSGAGEEESTLVDSVATARALAVFVHEDLRLGPVHVLPGARVEHIYTTLEDLSTAQSGGELFPDGGVARSVFLPGLGLLGQVGDWVDVFAGSYRGFSPVAPGQPEDVRPELSWNSEAGVRAGDSFVHGELVGFWNEYSNISGACTFSGGCTDDQVGQQYNGGAARVAGVESLLGYDVLLPGAFSLPVEATYTWTWSMFQTGFVSPFPQFGSVQAGDVLPYVPAHQASGRITLRHPDWSVGFGVAGRSEMLDAAGEFGAGELSVPSQVLVDGAASVRLAPRLLGYLTATNITQNRGITSWRPFGARPTAPFQVMVGLKLGPESVSSAP